MLLHYCINTRFFILLCLLFIKAFLEEKIRTHFLWSFADNWSEVTSKFENGPR